MIRNILGVIVGYIVIMILTGAMILALVLIFPEYRDMMKQMEAGGTSQSPPTLPVAINLALGLPINLVAGYLCARIASNARRSTQVFAGIVVVFGIMYFFSARGGVQPTWYLAGLPIVGVIGILLGGMLHLRTRANSSV